LADQELAVNPMETIINVSTKSGRYCLFFDNRNFNTEVWLSKEEVQNLIAQLNSAIKDEAESTRQP
jgi:hypothetical protein